MFRTRWIAAILVLIAGAAQATSYGHPLENRIWDLREGVEIDRATLITRLSGADVTLLGEVHDNAEAHRAQAAMVRLLEPAGLAVEMIPTKDEDDLNAFLAGGGSPSGIGPRIGWEEIGWPDWKIYEPVFAAWKPGVLTGGGVPREEVRRAMKEGAAAIPLTPSKADLLRVPLSAGMQESIEADMVVSHCGHFPKEMAPAMVEAQRLRDASLAAAVSRARDATGGKVALIAGNGHTRKDRGAGTYLPGELKVLSVGVLETHGEIGPETVASAGLPYDFVWFVPPAEREDPCAVFKKKKNQSGRED